MWFAPSCCCVLRCQHATLVMLGALSRTGTVYQMDMGLARRSITSSWPS